MAPFELPSVPRPGDARRALSRVAADGRGRYLGMPFACWLNDPKTEIQADAALLRERIAQAGPRWPELVLRPSAVAGLGTTAIFALLAASQDDQWGRAPPGRPNAYGLDYYLSIMWLVDRGELTDAGALVRLLAVIEAAALEAWSPDDG
jgi:hypothetical protein